MRKANVIAVVTGKGGVGKTTITYNLSGALSEAGKRVLIIDGDYEKPDAFGIYKQSEINKKFDLIEANYDDIRKQISSMLNVYDYIIIDTPPNFNVNALKVCIVCDLIIIPAAPSLSDENAVGKTIEFINTVEKPYKIVMNKIVKNQRLSNSLINEVSKTNYGYSSYITVKVAIQECAYEGMYVGDYAPNSASHIEFRKLAREVTESI